MNKKIHTVKSSDRNNFNKQVDHLVEVGGEILKSGYNCKLNEDGIVVYSQDIVFKNCELKFYDNGQLKEIKNKNEGGQLDGSWNKWFENGQKHFESYYENGRQEGKFIRWFENGQKDLEMTYKNYKKDGKSTEWYRNGNKKTEITHKNGEFVSWIDYREDGTVLKKVEEF